MIAASILSADLGCLRKEVEAMVAAGVDAIHFDVMDHHYVPNLTFGAGVCRTLMPSPVPLEVHLMVEPLEPVLADFVALGVDKIYFHADSCQSLSAVMDAWPQTIACGWVINPSDSFDLALEYQHQVDEYLIMTVQPGFGGQACLPGSVQRVQAFQQRLSRAVPLAVDGGVTQANIAAFHASGVGRFVLGSALFDGPCAGYAEKIAGLRQVLG